MAKVEITKPEETLKVEKATDKKKKYIVVAPFRDKTNFNKKFQAGEDVSSFDKGRLDYLLGKKLIELK